MKKEIILLDFKALTKIQSIFLIAIIFVAAVGGTVVYFLLSRQATSETIKIGLFFNMNSAWGKSAWQGLVLAAEQLNLEGGILGREVEVVSEDSTAGVDANQFILALARLITYHDVDFIIGSSSGLGHSVQDVIYEHKIIFFELASPEDEYTQRVLDDYDSYKYYFRVGLNNTSTFLGITDNLLFFREETDFNKVGYLGEDLPWTKGIMEGLDYVLPEVYGFDLIHKGSFPPDTVDFSSYFAAAEAAGVEILMPLIALDTAIPFVKEYNTRQSPMLIYGGVLGVGVSGPEGWEITDGKCEYTASASLPAIAGYPLTSVTLPFACRAYDVLRFILPDAVGRAGTLDVDAVIKALEATSVETTNARAFTFTSSHDLMMANPNDPDDDNPLVILFQWIDEEQVPVYPKKIMEEAGVTYTYPDWPGPWD